MTTLIMNKAGQLFSNKPSERDVTVKLTDEDGTVRYCNGFITELGAEVFGCTLDPDADCVLEHARPEVSLTLLGYTGWMVKAVEAWCNTPAGPRTVFRQNYGKSGKLSDTSVIVGPAY